MKKVHIINGGALFRGNGGTLSRTYVELARETLEAMGWSVTVSDVDGEWVAAEESAKLAQADCVIAQFPAWWMGAPWQFKRYVDEVFFNPLLSGGDGRHHDTPDVGYGTGGQAIGKRYMLSTTWNAPEAAFVEPDQFFEGRGIDGVLFPMHKAFQFIGMEPLESFMANDVIKNPQHARDFTRFRQHIERVFGAL